MFLKWPFIGMIVETIGFLNLFGYVPLSCFALYSLIWVASSDFFPVILTFLRQLPGVGHILTLPYIRDVSVQCVKVRSF